MKFNKDYDYEWILDNLLKELDKYVTFPEVRKTSKQYNLTEPSICSSTDEIHLMMYDIELEQDISDILRNKWEEHSKKCSQLYLVVPKPLKNDFEQAVSHLLNCSVITYEFLEDGNNRNVKFDYDE